jgi:hypothetical protein
MGSFSLGRDRKSWVSRMGTRKMAGRYLDKGITLNSGLYLLHYTISALTNEAGYHYLPCRFSLLPREMQDSAVVLSQN